MRFVNEAILRLMTWVQEVRREEGQTLAEYGLIMAVIAVAIVVLALIAFRGAIVSAFDGATSCLSGNC